MAFIIQWIIGNLKPVLTGIAALLLFALVIGVEEWRITKANAETQQLKSLHQSDLNAVEEANFALEAVQDAERRANKILADRADLAESELKKANARYQQIMGVKNEDDAPVANVLRDSVERLRGSGKSSTTH
jgi:hypothetical protein